MLSFSNFGSVRHPEAEKVARAVQLLPARDSSMIVDGEMPAAPALAEGLLASANELTVSNARAHTLHFFLPSQCHPLGVD